MKQSTLKFVLSIPQTALLVNKHVGWQSVDEKLTSVSDEVMKGKGKGVTLVKG